jgi:hypothetical protein
LNFKIQICLFYRSLEFPTGVLLEEMDGEVNDEGPAERVTLVNDEEVENLAINRWNVA